MTAVICEANKIIDFSKPFHSLQQVIVDSGSKATATKNKEKSIEFLVSAKEF
jgi:hypothetical protein